MQSSFIRIFTIISIYFFSKTVATTTTTSEGSLILDNSFRVEWKIQSKEISFQFTWDSEHDYVALGLHNTTNQGMPNSEIFMCTASSSSCVVRHSTDYVKPNLSPVQYLSNITVITRNDSNVAMFSRTLEQPSYFSVSISNKTLGLIFARGETDNSGEPLIHDTTPGRWHANFFTNGPSPGPTPTPTPTPSPSPPSPHKKAGVWPDLFDAHMTIAPSQPPGSQLSVKLGSRLRYDFPNRRQLWEYFDVQDSKRVVSFSELWINNTLYELDHSTSPWTCTETQIDLEILRPDWLVHTTYVSTHFLLRQPEAWGNASESCFASTYQSSDLFQDPAPIGGMTNNWLLANSSMAEPIRLEGPDNFARPTWLTVQEWSSMKALKKHESGTFDIPPSCHRDNTSSIISRRQRRRLLRVNERGNDFLLTRLRPRSELFIHEEL